MALAATAVNAVRHNESHCHLTSAVWFAVGVHSTHLPSRFQLLCFLKKWKFCSICLHEFILWREIWYGLRQCFLWLSFPTCTSDSPTLFAWQLKLICVPVQCICICHIIVVVFYIISTVYMVYSSELNWNYFSQNQTALQLMLYV